MKNNMLLRLPFLVLVQSVSIFSAPGDIDTTFGTGGMIVSSLYHRDIITSCTVQPDDSIVVAGQARGFYDYMKAARFTPNGSIDTSFDTTGSTAIIYGLLSTAQGMSLQSDNKIILAGYTVQSHPDILFARLNSDGTLDMTTTFSIGIGAQGNSILQQPDTNILIGGIGSTDQANFALVRCDSTGVLDAGFGVSGIVTTAIGLYASIKQIALQTDNKIIAVGTSIDATSVASFVVARYNSDGTLDATFGPGGDGIVLITPGAQADANSIVLQSDGNIVVAGGAIDPADNVAKFVLARLDSNGNLDGSFGGTGIVFTKIMYESMAYNVIIQPDGKIIAGGYSSSDIERQFALARYNTDGSLDTTFGVNGIVLTSIGTIRSNSEIRSLALQSTGNIIAAGFSSNNAVIVRYLGA